MYQRLTKLGINLSIILTLCFGVFTIARIISSYNLFDYQIYYHAVEALKNQTPIYSSDNDINYSPAALILMIPISWANLETGQIIFTLLSSIFFLGSLAILFQLLQITAWQEKLGILALSILSFPYKFTLGMGQINMIILFLLCLNLFFYFHKKSIYAGIALGLAVVIKLTPILLLAYFAKRKQWSVIISTITTYLMTNLIAIKIVGWETVRQYYLTVLPVIPTVGNASYYNQALTGFLARSGVAESISALTNYSVLAILLVISYFIIPTKRGEAWHETLLASLFLVVGMIGMGLTWQHHLVWLVIPFTALWSNLRTRGNQQLSLLSVVAYSLISLNIKNPSIYHYPLAILTLSHGLYGMLIMLYLIYRLTSPEVAKSG